MRDRAIFGDVAMVLAGPLLVISTFLVWSHQFSAAALARYGGNLVLQGVPHDPDAWQVYSTVDVLLVVLAIALVAVALAGARTARWVLLVALAVALAFCAHAVAVAPTNGTLIGEVGADGVSRYVDTGASSGIGELVALAALSLGGAGVLATLLVEPRSL